MRMVGAKEFMAVMIAADLRYQHAAQHYVNIQRGTSANKANLLNKAAEKAKVIHDEIVWLVAGLLDPGSEEHGLFALRTARKLLRKSRCRREGESRRGGSPAPVSQLNASDRLP